MFDQVMKKKRKKGDKKNVRANDSCFSAELGCYSSHIDNQRRSMYIVIVNE